MLHECRIRIFLYQILISHVCMARVRCCCIAQVAEEEMQHLKQASHAYAYASP